jgi:hypothetical protein
VANTLSNPLMPNVPDFYAPWTYDEILITVPAQQHTRLRDRSHCSPATCEGRVDGQPRSKRAGSSGSTPIGSTCCA